jgi:hypothetical protein
MLLMLRSLVVLVWSSKILDQSVSSTFSRKQVGARNRPNNALQSDSRAIECALRVLYFIRLQLNAIVRPTTKNP